MITATFGALLGLVAGLALLLVVTRVRAILRPSLADRVVPYLRDLSGADGRPVGGRAGGNPARITLLRVAADRVDRTLGGATSVRRRLERAGSEATVQDFRVRQVQWGLVGFAAAAALSITRVAEGLDAVLPALLLCVSFALGGVLACDWRLSSQVAERERRIMTEFPTVAELLALAVAAGEGPVVALDRVVRRSNGALADDLRALLAEIRTGEPVGAAFDRYAYRTGLPTVSRFAQAIAVAIERGTPLADVLHAQAADVREVARRDLIESAARKEIAMMVPVVFLVLPVTVVFAFWPGLVGLRLSAS